MKTGHNRGKYKKVLRYPAVVLAAVVIFVTTYSLILPALTLEQAAVEEEAGITLLSTDEKAAEADASANPAPGNETPSAEGSSAAEKADEMQSAAEAKEPENRAAGQPDETAQKNDASGAAATETPAVREQATSVTRQQGSSAQKAEQQNSAAKDSAADAKEAAAEEKQTDFPAQSFEAVLKKSGATEKVAAMEIAAEQTAADTNEKEPADEAAAGPVQKQADARNDLKQQTEPFATIHVEAGEGAFPAGTTMKVADVSKEQDVKDTVAESVDGKITSMQAFDISFYNKEGEKIEPAKEIKVSVISDRFDKKEDPEILHISEAGGGS